MPQGEAPEEGPAMRALTVLLRFDRVCGASGIAFGFRRALLLRLLLIPCLRALSTQRSPVHEQDSECKSAEAQCQLHGYRAVLVLAKWARIWHYPFSNR